MNNSTHDKDIIVALATPYGRSAIAVIRVCGDGCIAAVERYLGRGLEAGKMVYTVFKSGDFEERLMAVCYKAPHSYCGQDTVELYPHGNMTICDKIVKALTYGGARLAERGEFTKRAFVNGKVDLMQCEALADIIDAQTDEQLIYGNKRFDGEFKTLGEAEELLRKALSTVEAVLHYGDELEGEEIDDGLVNDVYAAITRTAELVKGELDVFAGGRIVNDGFKIALIGAPNVGKSTMLNALLGDDRAIVTPIAGTTRDTVDGEYVYNGKKFVVIDTAGLTETDDTVEKIGVERAIKAAKNADITVLVTAPDVADAVPYGLIPAFTVKNKCDSAVDVGTDYAKACKNDILELSAGRGINITALRQKLYDLCPKASGAICNHRQYACALRCYDACLAANAAASDAQGLEIVAAALYEAYSAITELYGVGADERVINDVFERFCVGK